MTEVPGLTPIEISFRNAEAPDDASLVVRAGPLTVEKIMEHARREEARFSYRGAPMSAVSVEATVGSWTLEAILRDRLWSRSTYAATTVGAVRRAGYVLLPTFRAPHFTLVLAEASVDAASSLLSTLGPAVRNPHRRRR